MRNDELVSPLPTVEQEKFFHLIKSSTYILIIQFDCTPVHIYIYKDCRCLTHVSIPLVN